MTGRRTPPKKKRGAAQQPRRFDGALRDIASQARALGVTEKTLRAQVARKLIPFRKLGGRIVFLEDEVHAFLHGLPGVTVADALTNANARNGAEGAR